MPPTAFPVVAMPMAKARLVEKYVASRPIEGVKKIPPPRPVRTPCVSIRCQYFVLTLIKKMPRSCSVEPTISVGMKNPASNSLPEKAPMKKVSQFCTVPIQLIVDAGSFNVRV